MTMIMYCLLQSKIKWVEAKGLNMGLYVHPRRVKGNFRRKLNAMPDMTSLCFRYYVYNT